jgi:hypothetical protein
VGDVATKPRCGDEPWTELPWALRVSALPDGLALHVGVVEANLVCALGAENQHALIAEIEREATERKASKVYLSKCFYRLLPQTYGGVKNLWLERTYCYAVFV